jgi:hypothetical protein
MTYINIGDLFEYVADLLWHTTGVLTNRVDFTLVNAFSPFTGFSYGSHPIPPKLAWPTGKSLILTFAISAIDPYTETTELKLNQTARLSNKHTRWSYRDGAQDYVSISVDTTVGAELGIRYPKFNELQYIYNLIGAMSKSMVRRQTVYRSPNESYEELHESYSLVNLHSRIFNMPIKNLFNQIPYHLWVFNGNLWRLAPNVIPQRLITPQAALYFFMYLSDVTRFSRCVGDVTMKRLGLELGTTEEGIVGLLTKSVLNMVQMIKTPGDRDLSDLELLAPAVLQALLITGSSTIKTRSSYRADLIASTKMLIEDLQARENDLGHLFMPPRETARKLILEDRNYIRMIENAMVFPQSDLDSDPMEVS